MNIPGIIEYNEDEHQFYKALFDGDLEKFKTHMRALDYAMHHSRIIIGLENLEFLDAYYMYYEDEMKDELPMFIEYAWGVERYKSMEYFTQKCIDNGKFKDLVMLQFDTIKARDVVIESMNEKLKRIRAKVLEVAGRYQRTIWCRKFDGSFSLVRFMVDDIDKEFDAE